MFKHFLLTLGVGGATCVAALAQNTPSFAFGKPGTAPRAAVSSPTSATALGTRPQVGPTGRVLTPFGTPNARSIIESLESQSGYNLFVHSAGRAALAPQLRSPGPYTVFVPTDAAFGALPAGRLEELWKPASQPQLRAMLASHIVAGNLQTRDLVDGLALHTLAGTKLTVHRQGNRIELEDPAGRYATLTATDAVAANGTIHTVGTVLAQP